MGDKRQGHLLSCPKNTLTIRPTIHPVSRRCLRSPTLRRSPALWRLASRATRRPDLGNLFPGQKHYPPARGRVMYDAVIAPFVEFGFMRPGPGRVPCSFAGERRPSGCFLTLRRMSLARGCHWPMQFFPVRRSGTSFAGLSLGAMTLGGVHCGEWLWLCSPEWRPEPPWPCEGFQPGRLLSDFPRRRGRDRLDARKQRRPVAHPVRDGTRLERCGHIPGLGNRHGHPFRACHHLQTVGDGVFRPGLSPLGQSLESGCPLQLSRPDCPQSGGAGFMHWGP